MQFYDYTNAAEILDSFGRGSSSGTVSRIRELTSASKFNGNSVRITRHDQRKALISLRRERSFIRLRLVVP